MDSHADQLQTDRHYGVVTAAVIAVVLIAYLGVSAILEATGTNVPLVNWPF
jgi:hypothetical protein